MTVDKVLTHFRAGVLTHEQACNWLNLTLQREVAEAKLEMLERIQADIEYLKDKAAA